MEAIDWQEAYQASLRYEQAEKYIRTHRAPKNGWKTAKQIDRWLRLLDAHEQKRDAGLILSAAANAASWRELEEWCFASELMSADEIIAEMAGEAHA